MNKVRINIGNSPRASLQYQDTILGGFKESPVSKFGGLQSFLTSPAGFSRPLAI